MHPPEAKRPAAPEGGPAASQSSPTTTPDSVIAQRKDCPIACSQPERCPWRCPVTISDAIAEVVDQALDRGEIVLDRCMAIVPDVVEAECIANGRPAFPATRRIRRHDGRAAAIFQRPT